ncbi:MAG: hypothetical protein QG657_5266 [Acidobacteriota bacterium]|nr:hypothetical protein [Acidobacteriota bacterium]
MPTKKILLVEGKDDENVMMHLASNRGGPHFDEIKSLEGCTNILKSIHVHLIAGGENIIGIVIDADMDIAARWRSLRDQLLKTGYQTVPDNPSPDGTIIDPPGGAFLPRVGVWIMPDNQTGGILEDFLKFLVPTGSRLFDHVTSSITAIPEGERRFTQLAEPKAIIHTWLAWQKEPGKPLGTAITMRFLDANVAQVDVLISWMNRLFFP